MSPIPTIVEDSEATGDPRWLQALSEGVTLLDGLSGRGFGLRAARLAETLLTLCHVVLFRIRTRNPYPLIGILGNADSGKSTLLGSIAGREISRVTPIPHQTTGPILAVPHPFAAWASDPSFLRPVAGRVEVEPEGTTGLSGNPSRAVVVPAWEADRTPVLLMDLPDVGTVDSREERHVALRILPWLDRILLLVTEETFAQAEHEEITQALEVLRPERARGDLFVILNRRHPITTDDEFSRRLETIRRLWPHATVSSLPHLTGDKRFSGNDTVPLVSEASQRVIHTLKNAVRNLAGDLTSELTLQGDQRMAEHRRLRELIHREIVSASRFSRSFFSDDFRRRLDLFSPWNVSRQRLRALLKPQRARQSAPVDLLADAAVQRHVAQSAQRIQNRVRRHLEALSTEGAGVAAVPEPVLPEEEIRAAVSALVTRTNQTARDEVEALLESLQEDRRIKDPLWGIVAGVSSSLLLLELVIPGFGTLSSMTFSGLLSALGFGGILTSDMMRKLRSNRLRESFESGMHRILEQAASALQQSAGPLSVEQLTRASRNLTQWKEGLPEV
jgi:hypothetical protein